MWRHIDVQADWRSLSLRSGRIQEETKKTFEAFIQGVRFYVFISTRKVVFDSVAKVQDKFKTYFFFIFVVEQNFYCKICRKD